MCSAQLHYKKTRRPDLLRMLLHAQRAPATCGQAETRQLKRNNMCRMLQRAPALRGQAGGGRAAAGALRPAAARAGQRGAPGHVRRDGRQPGPLALRGHHHNRRVAAHGRALRHAGRRAAAAACPHAWAPALPICSARFCCCCSPPRASAAQHASCMHASCTCFQPRA